jgi:non-ribosomal peptide synthase protein (TIGR01720 family)
MHWTLDLEHGPLLRMLCVHYGGRRPDQLLVVVHHMVVDGVSWRVLMEDLQTAYEALRDGRAVRLPAKTTSYKEWTERLTHLAAAEETHAELGFWTAQVEPPVAALPRDRAGENTEAGARTVTVELSPAETESLLRDVHARHKLDVHHVLLHSLAEACAPWTGSRELLVDLEGHGRAELFPDADPSRTVGWFTSLFPVRLRLPEGRDDGLLAVRELFRQLPAQGVGYGLLRYLSPDASVRRRLEQAAQAEIIFNYLGQADASAREGAMFALSPDPVGAPHAPTQHRRHLLNVNGIVRDGRLQAEFTFSEQVHAPKTVQALADRFIAATRRTIEEYGARGAQLSPSDFPDLDFTQEELDGLLSELQTHEVKDAHE